LNCELTTNLTRTNFVDKLYYAVLDNNNNMPTLPHINND